MYRIIESKLRERFKDNPPKKRPYYSYCSDNECETFFPITTHYEILHLRVNVWPKIKKKVEAFCKDRHQYRPYRSSRLLYTSVPFASCNRLTF